MTTVKTFRWNPTVGSFVLSEIQAMQKAGQKTGVQRFQRRFITGTYVGWECRVTATDEGFAYIADRVAHIIENTALSGGIVNALPEVA